MPNLSTIQSFGVPIVMALIGFYFEYRHLTISDAEMARLNMGVGALFGVAAWLYWLHTKNRQATTAAQVAITENGAQLDEVTKKGVVSAKFPTATPAVPAVDATPATAPQTAVTTPAVLTTTSGTATLSPVEKPAVKAKTRRKPGKKKHK